MRRHPKRRAFAPRLTTLEPRRLLALAATWIGQDGSDFAGTEGLINPQRPNDYQDIHLRLTGLSGAAVARVTVTKAGGQLWAWGPNAPENAVYRPNAANPSSGDFYMEPLGADPAGTVYQDIHVVYADGTSEDTQLITGTAVDPNRRTPGAHVAAIFLGQVQQDWTGPYIGVGPDGFQDVEIALSNLSAGADCHVTLIAATSPIRIWQSGVNPDGHWNAELLNRPGENGTLGTTADLFFSSDVNLADVPLTLIVTYEHQNQDGSYTNRSGRTDAIVLNGGAMNPGLAMPVVAESNLPIATATSLPQDASSPGYSHAALDAASLAGLPSGQTFASVQSAVLSNLYGSSWVYADPGATAPYAAGSSPMTMRYDPTTGVFDFLPVRDERGSTLDLLLTFDDGSQAVARFDAAPSDINLRVPDTRIGAPVQDVASAAELLSALQAHAANIHLSAGAYTLDAPLSLTYPVSITAAPGAVLNFAPSGAAGSPWNTSTGAILVASSHVGLDGFAIRFQGDTSRWTAPNRAIIQAGLGDANVDLTFTYLDVQAPAAAVSSGYEGAFALMNFDPGDSGKIANDILKGGWIQLGVGPWLVTGNDYRGAVARTITPTFMNVHTSHDLTITDNHAHQVDPGGIAQRFLVYGGGDSGQGIGNLIEDNTIDGGIGTPAAGMPGAPPEYGNNPEIILAESYQPRFEGKPSSVSPDGYLVQVPMLRGPAPSTGDVVSILTGPYAGQWRMIAQALSPTRYLLTDPLPPGDYVIAVGRGFVDQTYRGNTIDLRGMSAGNVALVISGNDWGTNIVDNTFLGGDALRIGAGSSEVAFDTPDTSYGAPWGWSRLPVLDLTIDGNLFKDAAINFGVAHDRQYNKSSSGRTYFTGGFSNNEVDWSDPSAPAMSVGTAGYTQSIYPWLTPDELRLAVWNNWGTGPSAGVAPTLKVYAAKINGAGVDDQTISLASTPPAVAVASFDQRGRDLVGGPTGPDGYQDVHIVIAGLSSTKTITQIIVTGYGGGDWRLAGNAPAFSLAVIRRGTIADLYLQPYQNESGRYLTVEIHFADGTIARPLLNAVYATARLPMPVAPVPIAALVAPVDLAKGKAATASPIEGASYAAGMAVDGDASTRWSSGQWMQPTAVAWIAVDLGAVYDVGRVTLDWEAAYAVDYQIQVSDDETDWTTVASVVGNTTSGVIAYSGLSARGRYVRVYCTRYNGTKNYSLYDVNVYGS